MNGTLDMIILDRLRVTVCGDILTTADLPFFPIFQYSIIPSFRVLDQPHLVQRLSRRHHGIDILFRIDHELHDDRLGDRKGFL